MLKSKTCYNICKIGAALLLLFQFIAGVYVICSDFIILQNTLTFVIVFIAICSLLTSCFIFKNIIQSLKDKKVAQVVQLEVAQQQISQFDIYSLFSIMKEGILLIKDESINYASPQIAYLLGMDDAELLGKNLKDLVHSEDKQLLDIDYHSELFVGRRTTLRLTTMLSDVRWVVCSSHLANINGEKTLLILIESIDSLKQVQQDLENTESQIRVFFERTPLGVALFDVVGQLKLANTTWRSVWSNIVVPSAHCYNIVQDHFLQQPAVTLAIQKAFSKLEASVSNVEHTTPWGEARWYNLNFHPLITPVGSLSGVMMIQQDITDSVRSRRRENELNEQLTTFRKELAQITDKTHKIIETIQDAIIVFDAHGKIKVWNSGAETFFNCSREKVIEQTFSTTSQIFQAYISLLRKVEYQPDVMINEKITDQKTGQSVNASCFRTGSGLSTITILRIFSPERSNPL